ncbi:MAG TPA: diguanylate cyclase [Patescibacteria group bacterium]|nr:diguanylate cyclase [Patescibacteria group bacterium]
MGDKQQTILIIDDSAHNIQSLSDILLQDMGRYKVISALSGEQALKILTSVTVDMVLLDTVMPGMDGYETCRRIKENFNTREIPVILLSGDGERVNESKGIDSGALDRINRPECPPAIIRSRVTNYLKCQQYCQNMQELAYIDSMTGVATQAYLNVTIEKEWRRALRNGDVLSLVLVDIELFKEYVETHGAVKGEDCLRRVAQTMEKAVARPGDLVARYGTASFVILLPSTLPKGAIKVSERVQSGVEALQIPLGPNGHSGFVSVRCGINTMRPQGENVPENLLRNEGTSYDFTKREQEVIKLITQGKTNKQISEVLMISVETVKVHVKNILAKAETTSRTALISKVFYKDYQ